MKSVPHPAKRDFTAKRFHQPQADFTRPQGRISLLTPSNKTEAQRSGFGFGRRSDGVSERRRSYKKTSSRTIRSPRRRWSGRRDSNSLPPPWQGGALPNELRPHQTKCIIPRIFSLSRGNSAAFHFAGKVRIRWQNASAAALGSGDGQDRKYKTPIYGRASYCRGAHYSHISGE